MTFFSGDKIFWTFCGPFQRLRIYFLEGRKYLTEKEETLGRERREQKLWRKWSRAKEEKINTSSSQSLSVSILPSVFTFLTHVPDSILSFFPLDNSVSDAVEEIIFVFFSLVSLAKKDSFKVLFPL